MPVSLKRALADYTPSYGLPVGSPVPSLSDLRAGLEAIEFSLISATRQEVAECVAKLSVGFNLQQTKDEAKMRLEVWVEAVGDLPRDLLFKGARALLQSYQFGMPKPSNLREIVQDEFGKRQEDLRHTKALLEQVRTQPDGKPFVREPWEVRVRSLRDSWRKVGNVERAAGYERQLAKHEGRAVEEWAREP